MFNISNDKAHAFNNLIRQLIQFYFSLFFGHTMQLHEGS